MAHIQSSSRKITGRVRRIQGQLEAVIRAAESGEDCYKVLQTAAACQGALRGLVRDLIEDHLDAHFKEAKSLKSVSEETERLKKLVRSFAV